MKWPLKLPRQSTVVWLSPWLCLWSDLAAAFWILSPGCCFTASTVGNQAVPSIPFQSPQVGHRFIPLATTGANVAELLLLCWCPSNIFLRNPWLISHAGFPLPNVFFKSTHFLRIILSLHLYNIHFSHVPHFYQSFIAGGHLGWFHFIQQSCSRTLGIIIFPGDSMLRVRTG